MARPEFQEFLRRHAGVFRRRDALECGLSAKEFELGTRRGDWVRYRGLWILASTSPSRSSLVWAALLKVGNNAHLTGTTCLALHSFQASTWALHISAATDCRTSLAGAVVLKDKNRTQIRGTLRGFPTVSRSRAVVDALRILDDRNGREVVHEALRLRWVSVDALTWWGEQLRGHNGMTQFRRQLKHAQSGTHAESEALFLRLLQRSNIGEGWRFNQPIYNSANELAGVGDCVHSEARVVIELDGMAWHTSVHRFQRDRTKQNALVKEGWRVLRFTWADLTERPDQVIADIREAQEERLHPL